ncbi:hypothetical protein GXW82_28765 [Streptacidiphilus sp. 4-A2]|nr:hypothetical protein [Streptacidiphilus sp. 4-A2]
MPSTVPGGGAVATAGALWAKGLEAARAGLRWAKPRAGRLLRAAARLLRAAWRLGILALERLRPLGVWVADSCWLIWDRTLREVRLLRRIRLSQLREVRSLADLRALRRPRGEKHEASRITTP